MKILKGRLHVEFKDLQVGDTFLNSDGGPQIKVAQSGGSKLDAPPHNHVCLSTGILYVMPDDIKVVKTELGVTGIFERSD
jgi:hypothetical protein